MRTPIPIISASVLLFLQTALPLHAGTYKEITGFGENPSGIKMFLYSPDVVASQPAVLVACHWCHGVAQDMYNGSRYCSLADKTGYYVIFPSAVSSDGCWDVASDKALLHNGSGDPLGIVSMVRYVIRNFKADSTRVYAVGVSSGAMMVNVLCGAYPDVFAAGAAFAGVPFGCFAGPNSWNADCAAGSILKTPAQWGDLVRAAYPGYAGRRPKIQLWHGTSDEVLNYRNLGEAVKQWTNVHGIDTVPSSTENNVFNTGWTRRRYQNAKKEIVVETITEQGVSHNLQVLQDEALAFLGLDKATGIRPVVAIDNRSSSGAAVFIAPNRSDRSMVTVRSLPGVLSLSIYSLNGRLLCAVTGVYSSSGLHTFTISKNPLTPVRRTSGPCILKLSRNGADAGTFRVIW
jgi:acetylxylan esterase